MRLYQPVLFVGLGGTGCDVGAELENRLRDEICGPDGNDFRRKPGMDHLLAYQLPSCVQFVYADVNLAELERLPSRVVPGSEHFPAVKMTARYVSDLVPPEDSYPELAMHLRMRADRETTIWLPPDSGEPQIIPLRLGAGQYPTVGRATLFGTFMHGGIDAALRDIDQAIGELSKSGAELKVLSDKAIQSIDVFVALSVAGGTGCGLFYDYLHLIGHVLHQQGLSGKIYPLVLMPSAFKKGLGGGLPAELNAGRALLDLFRLVDEQNAAAAQHRLQSPGAAYPVDPEDLAVHYPGTPRIALDPGRLQTGFLFSRPGGAEREDMHREMVSLVTSLVGTELTDRDQRGGVIPASFAESWVNDAGTRGLPAVNGIGNRGVSTALVASLTVPIDELAGILAARLLRDSIEQLSKPTFTLESNRDGIKEFLTRAGVGQILQQQPARFQEPGAARGARDVTAHLSDRLELMGAGIESLRAQLSRDAPGIEKNFHPDGAIDEMLATTDIFRLQRIVFGHPNLSDPADRMGAGGMLHRRRESPPAPNGSAAQPPIPVLRDRLLHRVQWNDEEPVSCRARQDAWHAWRTYTEWAKSWDAYTPQWRRKLERSERNLTTMTKELLKFARDDHDGFRRRSEELQKKRVGVSFMLPTGSGAGPMEQFYEQVISRLRQHRYNAGQTLPTSAEHELLQTMVSTGTWREAYGMSGMHGPETAVAFILEQVKAGVKVFLRESVDGQPILPTLADLLNEAAGHSTKSGITQDYLDEFKGKLAGLLPANFMPQGNGPLKVLVSYSAGARAPYIEEYLKSAIRLPPGIHDFRDTDAESISVVLFRTAMGVTEVGEVREVLRTWANALTDSQQENRLKWRQRTGYNFGYLASREEHRVRILQRILCALWNGKGAVAGPDTSPEELSITLSDKAKVVMPLPLRPFGQASSWASLLQAYELWALDDSTTHRLFCEMLMKELPEGLDATPKPPSPLYDMIRNMAPGQIEILDEMAARNTDDERRARIDVLHAFWAKTLESALNAPFGGPTAAVAANLRELENEVAKGGAAG
jgi:Tubulin like